MMRVASSRPLLKNYFPARARRTPWACSRRSTAKPCRGWLLGLGAGLRDEPRLALFVAPLSRSCRPRHPGARILACAQSAVICALRVSLRRRHAFKSATFLFCAAAGCSRTLRNAARRANAPSLLIIYDAAIATRKAGRAGMRRGRKKGPARAGPFHDEADARGESRSAAFCSAFSTGL